VEVGGREVERRGKFWGRKEAKKNNTCEQGGCVFGSIPKRLQRAHLQLVHWWLLVRSSQNYMLDATPTSPPPNYYSKPDFICLRLTLITKAFLKTYFKKFQNLNMDEISFEKKIRNSKRKVLSSYIS
jgi:hypothetical protein